MADSSSTPFHQDSLSLPSLSLEVYAESDLMEKTIPFNQRIMQLWPYFLSVAQAEGILEALSIQPERQTLEVELTWVNNAAMQELNREYRDKDTSTDVLTFALFADSPDPSPWRNLPILQLGSVFICVDWAEAAVRENPELNLERYLLERFAHGLLHLLGQHHDTMEAYHRVVAIQKQVLDAVFTAH